jgi:cysteine desulfurase
MVLSFVMRTVYLDNNSTTPVDPAVLEALRAFLEADFGNASSVHQQGQKARAAVEKARYQVADLIGADAGEVVFTSGGTEADNLAVLGTARARQDLGRHVVTSEIEHPAVLKSCEWLEELGYEVTYLKPDAWGVVAATQVEEALREDTILVSIMGANNEVGSVQPLAEIGQVVKGHRALFHSDAVQMIGKTSVDVEAFAVDLLSMSAHKFHGPKGIGALYVRDGVEVSPRMLGGGQERGRRGGTENVPGIVGMGQACAEAGRHLERFGKEVCILRDRFERGILGGIPETKMNGPEENRMPHVSNISFLSVQGESLLVGLDFQGVSVSTGAACHSGSVSPSHVLTAMGLTEHDIKSAIRFSLSRMTTWQDVDYVLEILPPMIARMREVTGENRS